MTIAPDMVTGESVSLAWLNTVEALGRLPGGTAHHVVTRVSNPLEEDAAVRAAADELSDQLRYPTIHTVANTIFPEQLARRCRDEKELGARYRAMYSTIRGLARANRNGTYFGRMVAYPNATDDGFDQLADTIRKLAVEQTTPGPKGARYELDITARTTGDPGGDSGDSLPEDAKEGPTRSAYDSSNDTEPTAPVYVPGRDTSPMGFPCLSFCSFQLDHGRLHLVAHYRRQHHIERGYGNYLGLSQLLRYTSERTGLEPGQLMVVAGVSEVDAPLFRIARLTRQCRGDADATEPAHRVESARPGDLIHPGDVVVDHQYR